MLKKFGALAILASSALMASATDYPQCFIKKNAVAPAGASGTDFEFTNSDLNEDFTPLKYRLCLDGANALALVSFQFTYASADGIDQVQTPRVGPDSTACNDRNVPTEDRDYYKSAKVVTNSNLVHSFSVTPRRDGAPAQEFFRITTGAGYQETDFAFTASEDLIGFYGKQSATGIT